MRHGARKGSSDERRAGFFWHLGTFTWVMILLVGIDVFAGDEWWVHWVAGIWGTILAVHFADAFVLGGFLGFHACSPGRRHPTTDEPAAERSR